MFYKKIDLLKVYFFLFSIGLIKVAEYITVKSTSRINLQSFKNTLCDWAAYYTGFKVYELSLFVIGLILFALFYFFLYLLKHKEQNWFKYKYSNNLLLVVIISATINIFILKFGPLSGKTVLLYLGLFFLGLTFFYREWRFPELDFMKQDFFSEKMYLFISFAIIIHLLSYIGPLIIQPILVENDYMDIPEKTILSNKKIIDNTIYINQHFVGDIVKYDPRGDGGHNPILKEVANIQIDNLKRLNGFFEKNFRRKYFYQFDERLRQLKIFHRPVDDDEKSDLQLLFNNIKDQISEFSFKSNLIKFNKKLSTEELEFLKFNKLELSNQAKAGWFLFHHGWVINPLHAVALGAPFSDQVLIYGFASSVWLKKVLDLMGGVNYQNYLKTTFILYPIYFISFLIGIWFIFRRLRAVAIGGMALGICYLGLSYQLLVLAPGFNPVRHFWDIWGFVLLNEYLKRENKFYMFAAVLLGLFSIVWSKDFGIALYIGIISSFFIYQYSKQRTFAIASAIILLIIGFFVYFLPIYGKNYNMLYMVMGVAIPGASKLLIIAVLTFISLGYVLLIKYLKENDNLSILMVAVFVYAQIMLIYFIWNPGIHHLIANAAGIILFGLILLEHDCKFIHRNKFYNIFNFSLIFAYFFMSIIFYKEKAQTLLPFKQHLLYQWNFENAKFKSTMDPELFEEAVKLIQKYSHSNGIYLISKYDAILPLISNKYNEIPAVSVALDMIGKKDVERMSLPILQKKPKYIFVDSDILRNYMNDIYNEYGILGLIPYDESIGRASVMDNMKQLFFRINEQYKLIEKGRLISVYKYKSKINK